MRSAARAAAIVALGVAAGCEAPRCSCERPTRGLLDPAGPAVRSFDGVTLLDPGQEPRVPLRVSRWAGFRYRAHMETSGSFGLEGQAIAAGPTLSLAVDVEVLRGLGDPIELRADGGVIRAIEERLTVRDLSLTAAEASAAERESWNLGLAALRETTLLQQTSEAGEVIGLEGELVGGRAPTPEVQRALGDSLELQKHFPFRFPEQPVGVGASWRFREHIRPRGVQAVQVADVRLRALDPETVTLQVVVRQEAARQDVPHPLDPRLTAVLEQYRGDAEGQLVVERETGLPVSARLVGTVRLTMSGEVGGRPERAAFLMATVTTLRTTLEDAGAGDAAP